MTKREKVLILGVFGELLKKPYGELNTFLGSSTIEEMQVLYGKLRYEDYCKAHGVRYKDMTAADFEMADLERRDLVSREDWYE